MNAVQMIRPYKWKGRWVFDDEDVGLLREPFILGMSEMVSEMVRDVPRAEEGFCMYFSTAPLPTDGVFHLKYMAHEAEGAWYRNVETRMCGWLCPATLFYFEWFPPEIYIKAEYGPLKESEKSQTSVSQNPASYASFR